MPLRSTLRIAEPEDDAAAVAAVYAPYVRDTVITFEVDPAPDAVQMAERMTTVTATYPWLVAEAGGEVLGYAYAGAHNARAAYRWSVDVGIYLAASAHRQGIGRRLYTALFDLLRAQGYVQAYAGVTLPNEKSVGLHEAMGFTPIGVYPEVGFKAGRWLDVGWWGLALTAPPAEPAEPVHWRDLPPGVLDDALGA